MAPTDEMDKYRMIRSEQVYKQAEVERAKMEMQLERQRRELMDAMTQAQAVPPPLAPAPIHGSLLEVEIDKLRARVKALEDHVTAPKTVVETLVEAVEKEESLLEPEKKETKGVIMYTCDNCDPGICTLTVPSDSGIPNECPYGGHIGTWKEVYRG